MTTLDIKDISSRRLVIATSSVLLLWAGYTTLQTLGVMGRISVDMSAALGFIPGLLGVMILLLVGLKREDCFLVFNPISRKGLAILFVVLVFALSAMLPVMVWQGWSWKAALILAPAGGIAQELFFRSALLPALRQLFRRSDKIALISHSVLFGLWHIGPLFLGAPIWAVIAVMTVPFISGIGWGWQVVKDKTVFWAMVQHSLIWVIGLQFDVAG